MKVLIVTDGGAVPDGHVLRSRARIIQDYGSVLIAEADMATVSELRGAAGVLLVTEGRADVPPRLDAAGRIAVEAWNAAKQAKVRKWDGKSWDADDEDGPQNI